MNQQPIRAGNWRKQRGALRPLSLALLILAGLTALMAAWLSTGLMGTDKWPIQWLELDGEFQRVSAEQVRAALAPGLETGFFAVDLEQVRKAAMMVPWVARVEVRKTWPDTVNVLIFEHRPMAKWQGDRLINTERTVFSVPVADQLQGLPELNGPDEREGEVLEMWAQTRSRVQVLGLDVVAISLADRGAWQLALSNGTRVHLGRESVLPRLQRFVSSWAVLLEEARGFPGVVDMRYTNGFAVQWQPTVGPNDATTPLPPEGGLNNQQNNSESGA